MTAPAPSTQILNPQHEGDLAHKPRVLVFDDDLISLIVTQGILEQAYEVVPIQICRTKNEIDSETLKLVSPNPMLLDAHGIYDPQDLKRLLERFPPDAIISDHRFACAIEDGAALIAAAKRSAPNIPYILCSADITVNDTDQKNGYVSISKPVDPYSLRNILADLIRTTPQAPESPAL